MESPSASGGQPLALEAVDAVSLAVLGIVEVFEKLPDLPLPNGVHGPALRAPLLVDAEEEHLSK